MNYLDIFEAKKVYKNGENVTNFLRKKFNKLVNTSEIIELAYELQSGSYIESAQQNWQQEQLYAKEISNILNMYSSDSDYLLDVGTGELTTLTLLLNNINVHFSEVFAFDVSWSRLKKGKKFFSDNKKNFNININTFVADIQAIPLQSKSIY